MGIVSTAALGLQEPVLPDAHPTKPGHPACHDLGRCLSGGEVCHRAGQEQGTRPCRGNVGISEENTPLEFIFGRMCEFLPISGKMCELLSLLASFYCRRGRKRLSGYEGIIRYN